MNGKAKCKILKEIRRKIAEENDIEWVVSECGHKGNCKGTCPKCESEVRKLERELSLRRRIGKAVAITGVSAACLTGLTACSVEDVIDAGLGIVEELGRSRNNCKQEPIELDGDVVYIDPVDYDGGMDYIEPDEQWVGEVAYDGD